MQICAPWRRRSGGALLTLIAITVMAQATAHEAHRAANAAATDVAPGYLALPYAPPTPGTYALPPIRPAADGAIIDDTGTPRRLHALFDQRITVLSFIYTHCDDANGCPLASFVISQAAADIARVPALAAKVRFVSLSFDPQRDTPALLGRYARPFRKPGVDWVFGTTADEAALTVLLAAYGQDIERDASGGTFSHVLRVYLIDSDARIRNEYTTSFLHSSMLAADIRTLAMAASPAAEVPGSTSLGPGDDKSGYEDAAYVTRSRALTARDAAPADLRATLTELPLGLPRDALNGPLPTDAQIALGRQLFFDRRLSHNDTLACASCHIPDQGYTNNELMTPIGIEGRTVKRNAPSLFNVGLLPELFHDARESRLEQQIWGPLLASNEMGNPSISYVLDELRTLPGYRAQFAAAFPQAPAPSMETLGLALAAYERALVSGDSPFDRWRYGGDAAALPAAARAGYALFTGKAGCSGCHLVGESAALFTDHELHNTGLGYRRSMASPQTLDVLVGPGTRLAVAPGIVAASSETPPSDLGRYEVTLDPADRWRYRTPSLRNVALTAPYMHDGSLRSLDDVIAFYAAGGQPNEGLDPRLKPRRLTAAERTELRAFLDSLTGSNVDILVRDAFAVPIGDRQAD